MIHICETPPLSILLQISSVNEKKMKKKLLTNLHAVDIQSDYFLAIFCHFLNFGHLHVRGTPRITLPIVFISVLLYFIHFSFALQNARFRS